MVEIAAADEAEPRDLMTVAQVADELQMAEEWVRQLIRDGLLRHTRVGHQGARAPFRVRRQWLDEYLDAKAAGGPVAPAAS